MKKLYRASIDVLYVSHENNDPNAGKYLQQELDGVHFHQASLVIEEIIHLEGIPEEWKGCPIYGLPEGQDMSPEVFLQDRVDYDLYLKLKEKFEPTGLGEC